MAQPGRFDPRLVDAIVQRYLRDWNVPGVAVAIIVGGEVVYLRGHGVRDVGEGGDVTPDTLFPIGSCTKSFTTAALALLVGEGKLGWDDPVRDHLPWFRLGDALADREVRLRDLLCHRTGLGGHLLLWYRAPWTQEEAVRRAAHLPLDRPFRTAYQYQSTMFAAAGFAAAAAAGTPWDELVGKRLCGPLGMKSTVFTSTAALKAKDVAGPHKLSELGRPEVYERYPLTVPDPAGSIHSSARDMARWLQFQMGDGTWAGKRLVAEEALAETHRPQIPLRVPPAQQALFPDTVQLSYGLAWIVHDYRGERLLSHGGAIDGFRCQLTMVPEKKVAVVLLCNLHATHMNLSLGNSLLDVALGLPPKDWAAIHAAVYRKMAAEEAGREKKPARVPGTQPSRELKAYAGKYEHPAYGTVRVEEEGGGLVLKWGSVRGALTHYHYDTFALAAEPIGPGLVTFTLDEAGGVARVKVGGQMNVEFRRAGAKGAGE